MDPETNPDDETPKPKAADPVKTEVGRRDSKEYEQLSKLGPSLAPPNSTAPVQNTRKGPLI